MLVKFEFAITKHCGCAQAEREVCDVKNTSKWVCWKTITWMPPENIAGTTPEKSLASAEHFSSFWHPDNLEKSKVSPPVCHYYGNLCVVCYWVV
jgi:hypothetical protein